MSRPYVGTSLLAGNLSALPGTRILLRFNLIMRLSFGGNFLFGRKSPGIARNHFTQILAKNSILRAMCMMGLPQLVQIISKILKTVRDDYICRASPSEMIYSFKNMSKHKNYFVWWEDLGRAE